jgi:cell volume regulation protein A
MLIPKFFVEMLIGVAAGFLTGKALVYLINKIRLDHEGLYPVLGLAAVVFNYAVTAFVHGNGFLSVYVMGLIVGNSEFLHKKSLIRFHSGLAWLMQIAMFLTLGLLIFPSKVLPVMGPGLFLSALLMLLARPISVFICLAGSKYSFKQKLMVSWVGLRGAVPIILAVFPLIAGVPKAEEIFNIVFFIVLTSALVQGTLIPQVSKFLGVYEPLKKKGKYPIEFDNMPGMDAELHEVFIPFESIVAGKALFDVGVPKEALVTLVSRDDKFIIPNGSTVIEGGDVLLVLSDKLGVKDIERRINVLKDKETIEREEKIQEEQEKQDAIDREKDAAQ